MVMTKPTVEAIRAADMGRHEAEKITEDIRNNFDSLGKKLIEVRDRKGYRALGYTSIESYCLTEFGKGRSRVYQLIEEAQIEEGIVTELAASNSAVKSLQMPGSYLRELKSLESPQKQIEAIALANKLAENEGKAKASKLHLQVAIGKLNQHKPEQTKQIIKELGFDKGAEVEVLNGRSKGLRGIIRKIDKKGIHVELHVGNSIPIVWDISDLKSVPVGERPQHPATIDTVSIGDKVQIFSSNGNKGKTGEIVARVNDKLALVGIDEGYKAEIPYAELERVHTEENDLQPPSNDSIWAGKWNNLSSWYYNVKEHQIHSFGCPDLILQPPKRCSNPSEWLENWRRKNLKPLIEAFFTQDDIAALTTTAAAESLRKADKELSELRLRLTEAETVIQSIVDGAKFLSPGDTAAQADFLLENTPESLNPGDTAAHTDFLAGNVPETSAPGDATAHTDFLAGNVPETLAPGDATAHTDFLAGNVPETSAPGDATAHSDFSITPNVIPTNCEIDIEEELSPEVSERLKQEWDKASNQLNQHEKKKHDIRGCQATKMNRKEIERLNQNLADQRAKLEQLEKFARFRVGQTVYHKRNPLILGKIIKLEFSQGGMPLIWVKYFRDGELEKTPTSELVNMIFAVEV